MLTDLPMLLNRQNCLLGLLDALGGRVSNLDFQKLLFLYCQEDAVAPYEFVPYKFGAFSFTSYADRRKLLERGLLVDEEQVWALTAADRSVPPQAETLPHSPASIERSAATRSLRTRTGDSRTTRHGAKSRRGSWVTMPWRCSE
jgi:hypothetical protein